MYPVIFEIGPITIYSLGIFWALGALAAVWILQLELNRCGHDAELAATIVMSAAIGGLIGARLLFVIEEWNRFTRAAWSFLLSGSGFSWFGGLLAGGLTTAWIFKKHRLDLREAADMSARPCSGLRHRTDRMLSCRRRHMGQGHGHTLGNGISRCSSGMG
jgi:phosphatidylglycerol:prolipoprotein diacylglycerol transferase